MNIGTVIRTKRQNKDLTQEQLAEYLNVSVSAVSQWESGKTTPDFSLLVPLAEFFGISLDELLGRTPGEKEKAIAEYDEKEIVLSSSGQVEESIALWREALKRFPGDYHCINNLASNLFLSICAGHGDAEAERKAKECISLCELILRDCTESRYRESAIQTLTYLYSFRSLSVSDENKAVEYAETAGEMTVSRQILLERAYFTEESRQKRMEVRHHNRLFFMDQLVQSLVYDDDITKEEYLSALETALKMWETLINDGNFLFYHRRIAQICSYIAEIYAGQQRRTETLDALEKALFHARASDTLPLEEQHYTSVFVRAATSDPSRLSKNYTETETQLILKRTERKEFDFLRGDREYSALIKKYEVD